MAMRTCSVFSTITPMTMFMSPKEVKKRNVKKKKTSSETTQPRSDEAVEICDVKTANDVNTIH